MSAEHAIAAQDAEAIRRLIADFHYLVDHGRATECASLFAPDAKLVFGAGSPSPGSIEGLDAIRAFLQTREAASFTTRHLVGTTRLVSQGEDRIRACSVLTLFRAPSDNPAVPAVIADLDEIYVRTGERWRLLVREVHPVSWP